MPASDRIPWMMAVINPTKVIGRSPDRLTLAESTALAGKYVAFEIYTPETLPFRRIEAIGDSVEECLRMLQSRGLDPRKFEFTRLAPPF
ncbi:MAG TPA: hypothetical protein VLW65_19480 [Bryobacteraceae bacterium]|nr:hypothetical protein [Bryobacteraceae bacterium]